LGRDDRRQTWWEEERMVNFHHHQSSLIGRSIRPRVSEFERLRQFQFVSSRHSQCVNHPRREWSFPAPDSYIWSIPFFPAVLYPLLHFKALTGISWIVESRLNMHPIGSADVLRTIWRKYLACFLQFRTLILRKELKRRKI
jgi:hypothetical protein